MARIGIVGLPNVGKTTLFNALTGLEAPTAAHPFSTVEPNIGIARVPDPLLEQAAKVEGSEKLVPATLELLDLPAMARPGSSGLGSKFLGRLREMEALAVVVRAFGDESIPADESGTDPVEQAESLLLELVLADVDVFGRKAEKAVKEAAAEPDKRASAAAVNAALKTLDEGRPLRSAQWSEQELAAFRDLAPLTLKPAVWVVNIDEGEADAEALVGAVSAVVPAGDTVVGVAGRLEEEAMRLDPAERSELLEGLGLGVGALARVVRAAYGALDLVTFYTVGPKESHAWAVRRGSSAREAAGKIHSDLERGFIRAEIAPLTEVVAAGGWDRAKAGGLVRIEGRDYTIAEGDVMVVRFSV